MLIEINVSQTLMLQLKIPTDQPGIPDLENEGQPFRPNEIVATYHNIDGKWQPSPNGIYISGWARKKDGELASIRRTKAMHSAVPESIKTMLLIIAAGRDDVPIEILNLIEERSIIL